MKDKDPQLNQLYQQGANEKPSQSVDESILMRAAQANQQSKLSRLRPWMAAASILFTIPFLWLLVQQPEMQKSQHESLMPEAVPHSSESADSTQPASRAKRSDSDLSQTIDPQDSEVEYDKITVTGSRIRRQESESDDAGLSTSEEPSQNQLLEKSSPKKKAHLREDKQDQFQSLKPEATEETMDSSPITDQTLSKPIGAVSKMHHSIQLLQPLRPSNLNKKEAMLWRQLEQQLSKHHWQQGRQSLKKLITSHPEIDFSKLSNYLDQLIENN